MSEQDFTTALASQTTWLERWFRHRGIDPHAVDDLVQVTLIEAWKNQSKRIDIDGMRPCLGTIVGFVLKR